MHSDMTNWQRLLASPACDVDGPHIYPWLQRLRRGASPSLKVLTASDCTYGSTSMDCDQKHPTCTRPIRGVPQGTQVVAWPGIQGFRHWRLDSAIANCSTQGFCQLGLRHIWHPRILPLQTARLPRILPLQTPGPRKDCANQGLRRRRIVPSFSSRGAYQVLDYGALPTCSRA